MINFEREVAKFVAEIELKGLPIDPEDTYSFGHAVMNANPPANFLIDIAQSLQFMSKEEFEGDLDKMTEVARGALGPNYLFAYSEPHKSEYWVYKQLINRGLHPAVKSVNMYDRDDVDQLRYSIEHNHQVATFDDFSISGATITDAAYDSTFTKGKKQFDPNNALAFICGITNIARKGIERSKIKPIPVGRKITTLREQLTEPNYLWLKKAMKKRNKINSLIICDALFWAWHKVPDNVPNVFTGNGFPPLIREELYPRQY